MAFNSSTFITISFILFAATSFAAGNNSLKGKVMEDQHGEGLPGASVLIPDLKAGAVTDSNGNYSIEHLPNGKYLVEVHLLGFSTQTKYVTIDENTGQNFQLHESIVEKNEVIITGTSLATEERRSVTPIQSIRMREMKENAYTNVVDAISKLPGISQVTTGPAISKPVIRGLSYNRVVTLNDGVRQEGQQWGDEHGIEIDDYNVSRIEVLKGPASLAYGSDALAGVINIISDEPVPPGSIAGNIGLGYQTNNGQGVLHGQLAGNQHGFIWNVYGTGKQAHDYHNAYDGYVFNSRFNNLNYGATIGLDKKWGYSHLSFTSFNQNLGLVEGERDSATGTFLKPVDHFGSPEKALITNADNMSFAKQVPAQRIEHQKLVWNNSLYLHNGARIGLTLGYQQNTRKEFGDVLQPDNAGLSFFLQTFNYDLKYFFPEWNEWKLTAGINGMQQKNINKGDEFLVPDYKLSDAGIYGIAKKDWPKWSVSGGVRFNYRTIAADALYLDAAGERVPGLLAGGIRQFKAFDKNFSNFVGSAGASYLLAERTSLKLNAATGFRAPNIAELSANGVHEGTIRYEYGNTALKAEQSFQTDLGLDWNSDHVVVKASVFYNYISNFIYIRKLLNSSGNDSIPSVNDPEGFPAFVYTQSNAGLYGGEFFVDLHPHPLDWLHFENTFSYVKGIIFNGTDSTASLPYIPAARWLTELRAQKRSIGKYLKNVYAKVELDINFAQNNIFSAYGTETASPGYALVNAGLGLDVVNRKQRALFSLNISANNLGDIAYQNHLSRLRFADMNYSNGRMGVFSMGRNVSFSLTVPLQFK